jgi:hypothetical protein
MNREDCSMVSKRERGLEALSPSPTGLIKNHRFAFSISRWRLAHKEVFSDAYSHGGKKK